MQLHLKVLAELICTLIFIKTFSVYDVFAHE